MRSRLFPVGMSCVVACAALLCVGHPAHADDPAGFDERAGNVFFLEPDRDTRNQIDDLIGRFAEDSVPARTRSRRELEEIGYWSVAPLIAALANEEPPIRAAAGLTLSAILDPRAVAPMRAAVERETSHPFVAGFAALGLARYRDPQAVEPLRIALRSSKSIHMLRAAAPLMLARIRTPEALSLLSERLLSRAGNSQVRRARMLALGFFPRAALDADGPEPSSALRKGLRGKKRELRRAAMVGYLVATLHRSDTKDVLMRLVRREKDARVLVPGLIGVSRFEDSETAAYLAHYAARSGERDIVRLTCCELLTGRDDAAALADLLSTLRRSSSAHLRAAAVLALGGIDRTEASEAVIKSLGDKSPLVRAAAGVASVRMPQREARDAALRRIESRLRGGESSRDARHNLSEARAVLSGERAEGDWREVGAERIFGELFLPYEDRVLAQVNLVANDALDLTKIRNLQAESDAFDGDDGGDPAEGGEGTGDGSNPTTPGSGPTPKDDQPGMDPPAAGPSGPTPGSSRIATWQELHDLKVDLERRPLFVADDLPRAAQTR